MYLLVGSLLLLHGEIMIRGYVLYLLTIRTIKKDVTAISVAKRDVVA